VLNLAQVGAGNDYQVTQLGTKTRIESHPQQGTNGNPSYDGYISIMQDGAMNKIWDADQAGSNNWLEVKQVGQNNTANIEAQVSSNGGAGNSIAIRQDGISNAVGANSSNGPGAYQEGDNNRSEERRVGQEVR